MEMGDFVRNYGAKKKIEILVKVKLWGLVVRKSLSKSEESNLLNSFQR